MTRYPPKSVPIVCLLLSLLLAVSDVFAEWFSPAKTGRITESGEEAVTCERSLMTPRELIEVAWSNDGSYEVLDEEVDQDTGKVKFVHMKVEWPGQEAATLMFFRSVRTCRFIVDSVSGMVLDDLDRYE